MVAKMAHLEFADLLLRAGANKDATERWGNGRFGALRTSGHPKAPRASGAGWLHSQTGAMQCRYAEIREGSFLVTDHVRKTQRLMQSCLQLLLKNQAHQTLSMRTA